MPRGAQNSVTGPCTVWLMRLCGPSHIKQHKQHKNGGTRAKGNTGKGHEIQMLLLLTWPCCPWELRKWLLADPEDSSVAPFNTRQQHAAMLFLWCENTLVLELQEQHGCMHNRRDLDSKPCPLTTAPTTAIKQLLQLLMYGVALYACLLSLITTSDAQLLSVYQAPIRSKLPLHLAPQPCALLRCVLPTAALIQTLAATDTDPAGSSCCNLCAACCI